MPDAVIVAGANGAGKTTFARQLLPLVHPDCVFLNADEIQREDPAFGRPAAAGRELLRRLTDRAAIPDSFAIETTLSSRSYARSIPVWQGRGFIVWLYFLEVASPDLAVARVAQRVAAGGHGVPEADVRRRYTRGKALFQTYRSLADAWYHFRVDQKGSVLVAHKDP
ncbi:MAG: zeta toxin family protein [Hyphomonadaceae bacterium]|nr:zeta toxin family protein [Hyphomonadaceae bacterium]